MKDHPTDKPDDMQKQGVRALLIAQALRQARAARRRMDQDVLAALRLFIQRCPELLKKMGITPKAESSREDVRQEEDVSLEKTQDIMAQYLFRHPHQKDKVRDIIKRIKE